MNDSKPLQISDQILYQHQLRLCQLYVRYLLQYLQQPPVAIIVIIIVCRLDAVKGILLLYIELVLTVLIHLADGPLDAFCTEICLSLLIEVQLIFLRQILYVVH